jgi:hypothetical protein
MSHEAELLSLDPAPGFHHGNSHKVMGKPWVMFRFRFDFSMISVPQTYLPSLVNIQKTMEHH